MCACVATHHSIFRSNQILFQVVDDDLKWSAGKQDLALRSSVFWCKFDPLTQLETMRKAQGEMLELEKTFGMDRVFEGLTSTQRMHVYISARKANSWWVNGLILRKFKEWKRRALQRRGSRPPPSRGSTAPQRSTSRIA